MLSDITLAWMQSRAADAGLVITPAEIPVLGEANWRYGPTDSYQQFLDGFYARTHPPFLRALQMGAGLNQVLDESVVHRCSGDHTYKPKNPGFTLPPPSSAAIAAG